MTDTSAPKRGRPPIPFDQETADYICERIASEPVSMKTICAEEGMPSHTTIWKWLATHEEFAAQYIRAKAMQQHVLMDETIDIADDGSNDWIKRLNHNGAKEDWEVNGEAIARSKLRLDQRKWMAAHLMPKTYGDKLAIDQTVGVSADLASLMERVATQGQRLTPKDEAEE